jgi:ribosomal protein S18 acetylase RimI-like enzyme
MSTIDILLLGPSDGPMLDRLAPGVFDHAVRPDLCAEFLADARHHLVVARDEGVVVGMASGVHYVHPDKAPQLFINEVGVAPTHRAQGLGRRMLAVLVQRATELGCTEAWVLTDSDNSAANRLYAAAGAETPAARA